MTVISFFSSMVVTPVCYAAIHRSCPSKDIRKVKGNLFLRFRNKQDENVSISRSSRVLRKRRNLVSMQFNMMNWLLEMISLIPVMFVENVFLNILYLMVNSCGTPLVILFNLPFYINKSYFFWYTFWALRKTGGSPGSSSSPA